MSVSKSGPTKKTITIRGVTYPSQVEAARALGVSEGAVTYAKARGKLDGLGMVDRSVTIRGTTYVSQSAAARALGVSASAVSLARANGRLECLGRDQSEKKDLGGMTTRAAPMRVKVRNVQQVQPHKRLSAVFHPHWCSRDDHVLLMAKAAGDGFATIAARLGRPCIAIEQRWHRLRCVPDIAKRLKRYGLTDVPYPSGGS